MDDHKGNMFYFSSLFSPTSFYLIMVRCRGLLHLMTYKDTRQSVGLPWTRDRPVAGTCTWQHTTLTTDKHPCPRLDSNPQSPVWTGKWKAVARLSARLHGPGRCGVSSWAVAMTLRSTLQNWRCRYECTNKTQAFNKFWCVLCAGKRTGLLFNFL